MNDKNKVLNDVKAPSAPTMTRARWKLEVLNMYSRQYFWKLEGFQKHFVNLVYDATKQQSELLVCEEWSTRPAPTVNHFSVVLRCTCSHSVSDV